MGEVGDVHHAEDHRETDRDERVRAPDQHPVQQVLAQDRQIWHVLRLGDSRRLDDLGHAVLDQSQVYVLPVRLVLRIEADIADQAVVVGLAEGFSDLLRIGSAGAADGVHHDVDPVVRGARVLAGVLLQLVARHLHEGIVDRVLDGVDVLGESVHALGGRAGELQVAVAGPGPFADQRSCDA